MYEQKMRAKKPGPLQRYATPLVAQRMCRNRTLANERLEQIFCEKKTGEKRHFSMHFIYCWICSIVYFVWFVNIEAFWIEVQRLDTHECSE